jgi:uncharacterized membrane protein
VTDGPAGAPGTGPSTTSIRTGPTATTLGLTAPHAAALAWSGGWLSGLAVWWLEAENAFVRRHAIESVLAQGGLMALAIGSWGLGLLMAFVTPVLFRGLTWLSAIAWVALAGIWIAGLARAWRGRAPLRLPFVSGLAERLTSRHSTPPAPRLPL